MTTRLLKTLAIVLLVTLTLSLERKSNAADQPNIIVILADDLGYSDLGCYGGEIATPNIDALAAGGVKLTQVYNSARCCPSRASLMTGLYPTQAGIGDFTTKKPNKTRGPGYLGRLRDDCVTMAEVLKPAGYGCYYVGKWHLHNETGPIKRGFDEFYGYTFDHSHDQYDADYYVRLPEGREKEIDPTANEYYATDVFNDYAIEFIKQGQKTDKPWMLFLGHSSPHFPVQCPPERADKYDETYLRGWDVLREERYARMQKLGLIDGERWKMSPREIVPVDRDDIANGFSGKQNPAWDSLEEDRQRDLARRMAVFAAMVEGVDKGVGQITEHLKQTNDLDNTLIVFLSDNGACYEWGPFGFDGQSRRGETTLRTGDDLRTIGGRGTHQSYGSAWANLGNTPFRMYKHFTHEGGISTPFIAHWPKGIGKRDDWVRDPAHMMDVLPTLMEAAGAEYPKQLGDNQVQPLEGTSLLPAMRGEKLSPRTIGFDHQAAHAIREGDWKAIYSKRMPEALSWELYNLADDRCELTDLAKEQPQRLASMVSNWEQWATRVGVTWEPYAVARAAVAATETPQIAKRSLRVTAEVESQNPQGVVLAQGGKEHGYALHFIEGKPAFDVRVNSKVKRVMASNAVSGKIKLAATLTAKIMTLSVNGGEPVSVPSPGLIPNQPVDPLSVGFDDRTAAGDYEAPNRFNGTVLTHAIVLQVIVDDWKYTLQKPGQGWSNVKFDDIGWKDGSGGFGTRDTPGSRVGTTWSTNNIWLRKSFDVAAIPANPALLISHDENAEVYINGEQVAAIEGFTSKYIVLPIPNDKQGVIKAGRNVMAVHCNQTRGGQFIDVHLIDADNVPALPSPDSSKKPFESELTTKWGEAVTAENAWTEYPRPQMQRDNWTNLNGNWDYAVTPIKQRETPSEWEGKILVPYSLESKLGGVQRLLDATEALWYSRKFEAKKSAGRRQLLNFEAVDYRCEAFVNGQSVGKHVGGNTPFSFDISEAIKDGENELIVRVEDATEEWQLRGKQVLNARGIWYTQVSGIWQTVWLEEVSANHLQDVKVSTDTTAGSITVKPIATKGGTAKVVVREGDKVVAESTGSDAITLTVPAAKLWSPASPTLYDLEVTLVDDSGKELDRVHSYAGIRDVGKVKDKDGHWRFTLNGEVVFHWGPLDQGWWPDGLLTPPSDEAMLFDIEWTKAAGFNMIRKHIKVEPRRFYYHCDRLGMMVWQDQVSGGIGRNKGWPAWTRLKPKPVDAKWPPKQHKQFMAELEEMIGSLESHPSIVVWTPFNEAWGQHQTVEVGKWTSKRDPSRIVNVASGGNFWPAGDIVDEHRYPHPGFPFELNTNGRFDDYIKVIGEFGGHGFPVKGHLWDANRRNWGYGDIPKNATEYKERYVKSIEMLKELQGQGIAAGVYTQTTDVEGEINGLMTYDRKVIKISAEELARLHEKLFANVAQAANLSATDASDHQPDRLAAHPTETPHKAAMADQFAASAFIEVPTDRKPAPVMDAETIRAGLQSHDKALYIKAGWIRDPYITLAPDGYFYLTGTQPNENDPRERTNPYNIGLGDQSIVGDQVRVYRSKDLIKWESLGPIFNVDDTMKAKSGKPIDQRNIWAPEVHWMPGLGEKGRWALVHCPGKHSSLALSAGPKLAGPWTHPMNGKMGRRHDPSLFTDDDGTVYMLWANTMVAPLSAELGKYTANPVRIAPSGTRPGPDGKPIRRIGHEGATMMKVGDKYVHLGTAWSTDKMRKGSYNLYYCVADKIAGPYGPRKFAGRFLGHGTPFKDKNGKWWCTAFFNANVPPLPREGIEKRDIGDNAQTINEQGVTIVPLDVRVLNDKEIYIRAKAPAYANPGPDESQDF